MNNLDLINPYVYEHFWKKNVITNYYDGYRALTKFISENRNVINLINEQILNGNFNLINENNSSYNENYYHFLKNINEARLIGKKNKSNTDNDNTDNVKTDNVKTDNNPNELGNVNIERNIEDDFSTERRVKQNAKNKEKPKANNYNDKLIDSVNKGNLNILGDEEQHIEVYTDNDNKPDDFFSISNFIEFMYDLLCDTWLLDDNLNNNKIYDENGEIKDDVFDENGLPKKTYTIAGNYTKYNMISYLNVKNVTCMKGLFAFLNLPNIDLSMWNVSKVKNMQAMFYKSTFNNKSIWDWDVSKVENFKDMFLECDYNKGMPTWTFKNDIDNDLKLKLNDSQKKLQNIKQNIKQHDMSPKADAYKKILKTRMKRQQDEFDKKDKSIKSDLNNLGESYNFHIMRIDEFINENKFTNYINKGFNKVKNVYSKIKNLLSNFIRVNTYEKVLSLIKDVNGVYNYKNYKKEEGYYGFINENDIEYKNYIKFLNYIKSISPNVNESRIGLSAKGIMDVQDWSTEDLTSELNNMIDIVQNNPSSNNVVPLLIWGAPGIGKTSIPKAIINEYNKKKDVKMGCIIADCSAMQSDGLSIPTPARKVNIDSDLDYILRRNNILIKDIELDELKKNGLLDLYKSDDIPKSWLPVYKPTGNKEADAILNEIANGSVITYTDDDNVFKIEKAGSGGIIFFDEYLRAPGDLPFTIANLAITRGFGEYKVGDKWFFILASNRPLDDNQIKKVFSNSTPAAYTRLAQCNFVPDFKSWSKWAKNNGFDDTILNFISENNLDDESSRWHNIDPEQQRSNFVSRFATPRTWANVINSLRMNCQIKGYDENDYLSLMINHRREATRAIGKFLPDKLTNDFINYYILYNNFSDVVKYEDIRKIASEFLDKEIYDNNTKTITKIRDKFNVDYKLYDNYYDDTEENTPIDDAYDEMINKFKQVKLVNSNNVKVDTSLLCSMFLNEIKHVSNVELSIISTFFAICFPHSANKWYTELFTKLESKYNLNRQIYDIDGEDCSAADIALTYVINTILPDFNPEFE